MHKLQIISYGVSSAPQIQSAIHGISPSYLSSGGRPAGVDVLSIIVVRAVLEQILSNQLVSPLLGMQTQLQQQINKFLLLSPAIPHLSIQLETYYSMFCSVGVVTEQAEHSSKQLFRHLTNTARTKNTPMQRLKTRITNVVNPSIWHG